MNGNQAIHAAQILNRIKCDGDPPTEEQIKQAIAECLQHGIVIDEQAIKRGWHYCHDWIRRQQTA